MDCSYLYFFILILFTWRVHISWTVHESDLSSWYYNPMAVRGIYTQVYNIVNYLMKGIDVNIDNIVSYLMKGILGESVMWHDDDEWNSCFFQCLQTTLKALATPLRRIQCKPKDPPKEKEVQSIPKKPKREKLESLSQRLRRCIPRRKKHTRHLSSWRSLYHTIFCNCKFFFSVSCVLSSSLFMCHLYYWCCFCDVEWMG